MRKLSALLTAGLVLGLSGLAMAANTSVASLSATATASVVLPININEDTQMSFGKFSPGIAGGGGGAVVVSKSGAARSATGAVTLVNETVLASSPSVFTVTGEAGLVYDITIPDLVPHLTGPGAFMIATLDPSQTSGTLTLGTNTFKVGASLAVAETQAAGNYTGHYAISVAYN